jgi:hypothetical protein
LTPAKKAIQSIHSPEINSRIHLANVFALISCIIFSISGANNMYLGDLASGIFLEILAFLSLLTLVFNRLNMVRWAISYLFLLITGAIFYFDSYSGYASGSYLFYFPLLFAIAHVFDYRSRQDRLIMLMHIVLAIVFPVIHLSTGHSLFRSAYLTDLQRNRMFIFNLSFSIGCMGYFVYLLVKANIERLNLMEHILIEENKLRIMQEEKNKEKEILLAELQHRLQNNLSLMTSLLRIKQESVSSQTYELVFKEIFHALQTVAHAHHLQKFDDGRLMVPLQDYLHEIAKHWKQLNPEESLQHKVDWKCAERTLNIKQCITLGLIFHEAIVLFSLLHQTTEAPQQLLFDVRGYDAWIEIDIACTLPDLLAGSKEDLMIYALIEQLDGELICQSPTEYQIRFRIVTPTDYLESKSLYKS